MLFPLSMTFWQVFMKKIFFYSAAFLFCILAASCRTQSEIIMFPNKSGNLVYTSPTKIKNADIPFFSVDLTMVITETGLESDASMKYTVAMNGMTKRDMENLKVELEIGGEVYPLSHSTIYVDGYGKGGIQIRLESKLSPGTVMKLVEPGRNLSCAIKNEEKDFSTLLDLADFKKKAEKLGIYF